MSDDLKLLFGFIGGTIFIMVCIALIMRSTADGLITGGDTYVELCVEGFKYYDVGVGDYRSIIPIFDQETGMPKRCEGKIR